MDDDIFNSLKQGLAEANNIIKERTTMTTETIAALDRAIELAERMIDTAEFTNAWAEHNDKHAFFGTGNLQDTKEAIAALKSQRDRLAGNINLSNSTPLETRQSPPADTVPQAIFHINYGNGQTEKFVGSLPANTKPPMIIVGEGIGTPVPPADTVAIPPAEKINLTAIKSNMKTAWLDDTNAFSIPMMDWIVNYLAATYPHMFTKGE